jgi:hypothetical protein
MRMNPLALALFGPALILAATSTHARTPGTVKSPKEAKAIAERDTGGKATSARRIPLNGASGGWEVEVRMPREDKGWRCIIDADTHMVLSKNRIDQPGRKGKAEGPIRMVEGTR